MYHLTLSDTEKESFQEVHYDIHNRKRTKINLRICFSEKDIKHYAKFEGLLNKSNTIIKNLNIYNLVLNPKKYTIEFIQRNHFDGFWKTPNLLSWHQDDYGATNRKVFTIIYYIRKDTTVRGGDLEYSDYENERKTHMVKEKDVLCFSGNIYHNSTKSEGFGCRDIIVVQFERLK